MAIKPETILGLCRRPISGPEKLLLAKVELDIDEFLKLNFEPDLCPYFILTEHLSLASMHELLRRYRSAGWKVAAWPNGRSTSLCCISCSENAVVWNNYNSSVESTKRGVN